MYFTIVFYENKHFDLSMIDVLTFDCQLLTARASTFLSVAQHGNRKVSPFTKSQRYKGTIEQFCTFSGFSACTNFP